MEGNSHNNNKNIRNFSSFKVEALTAPTLDHVSMKKSSSSFFELYDSALSINSSFSGKIVAIEKF